MSFALDMLGAAGRTARIGSLSSTNPTLNNAYQTADYVTGKVTPLLSKLSDGPLIATGQDLLSRANNIQSWSLSGAGVILDQNGNPISYDGNAPASLGANADAASDIIAQLSGAALGWIGQANHALAAPPPAPQGVSMPTDGISDAGVQLMDQAVTWIQQARLALKSSTPAVTPPPSVVTPPPDATTVPAPTTPPPAATIPDTGGGSSGGGSSGGSGDYGGGGGYGGGGSSSGGGAGAADDPEAASAAEAAQIESGDGGNGGGSGGSYFDDSDSPESEAAAEADDIDAATTEDGDTGSDEQVVGYRMRGLDIIGASKHSVVGADTPEDVARNKSASDRAIKMATLKQVPVSIALILLKGGVAAMDAAYTLAALTNLPGGAARDNVAGKLRWHADALARVSSKPNAIYASGPDLKIWVLQAYAEWDAAVEGAEQVTQAWMDMWSEIGAALARLPKQVYDAVTTTVSTAMTVIKWLLASVGIAVVVGVGVGVYTHVKKKVAA